MNFIKQIRPEEWLIFTLWLLICILCLSSGTGFNPSYPFERYLKFFATYIVGIFFISRILLYWAQSWDPKHSWLQKIKTFFFGKSDTAILQNDLELVRGSLLLFASLSMYSNLKQRIPAINPTIGDPFFQRLDGLLFGKEFAPWLENLVQNNRALSDFLMGTYMHDYFWMVLLLFLVYLRKDHRAIRWIFGSVALTYLCALLITTAYPSYGLFFLEPDRFEWVDGAIKKSQNALIKTYSINMKKMAAGKLIRARPFHGIAAFPSLHIGHMVIMLIIAVRLLPVYAIWMLGVCLVTFVATVAFGWHYSVDAIGGIIVAGICTVGLHRLIYKEALLKRKRAVDPQA